tara:strand:- start:398 stop:727 length:330 start_codon:yes stop_codon:yes gene_type:complete
MTKSYSNGYKDMFERNRSNRSSQIGSDFSTWRGKIEYDLTLLNMLRDNELITEEVYEDNDLALGLELVLVDKLFETISNFVKTESGWRFGTVAIDIGGLEEVPTDELGG